MTEYSNLPYDILYALCSLLHETDFHALHNLSLVDKRSRAIATIFLFLNIGFRDEVIGDVVPWEGMSARLDTLLQNNHILKSVRSVLGHISTYHSKAVDFRRFILEPFIRDPDKWPIPIALFDLLRALTGLKELHLLLHPQYLEQVRNALLDSFPAEAEGQQDNRLSSVISLALPTSDWLSLSPAFPNLSKLEIRLASTWGYPLSSLGLDFAALAKAHPNLTTLHCHAPSTTKVIQGTHSHAATSHILANND
jgi:hypothetical protein